MRSLDEIEAILGSGYELRGFEVKGPGLRTDKALFVKVARAMMSMANLRDGGVVLLGVDDKDLAALGPGMTSDEAESWESYDDVARSLAEYTDPPIKFDLQALELSTGARVVVIEVHEFDDVPVLCAKDYPGVLRKGALYVRPRKLPETAEVASSVEMRDVLQLATEKALRSFLEIASRAGAEVVPSGQTAADQFEAQREEPW